MDWVIEIRDAEQTGTLPQLDWAVKDDTTGDLIVSGVGQCNWEGDIEFFLEEAGVDAEQQQDIKRLLDTLGISAW